MDFQAVGVNRAVGRAERCFAPAFGNPSHRSSPRSPCTAQISALGAPTASVAFHLPDPSPPPSIPSVPSAVPMPRACLSSSPLSEGDGCLSGIDLPSPSPSESLRADVRGRDGLDESASPPPSCSSESNKEGPLPSVSSGSSKSRRGRSGKGDERDKDSEGEKWNGQEGEEEQSQPTDDVERKTETAKTDQDALGRVEEGQEIKSRKRGGYRHNRSCPERYMILQDPMRNTIGLNIEHHSCHNMTGQLFREREIHAEASLWRERREGVGEGEDAQKNLETFGHQFVCRLEESVEHCNHVFLRLEFTPSVNDCVMGS
uniref:Uncharacterized protein n=1 Tax=Chromera velia CCMP2878 TaxID=1169474 RepID=A0A0K6S825_9ALVE|eukprot:Cvel_5096.t2-p1 / transcript=Cvel_5096.t2 / gene=Cvel_5096 / organism=Chromera_velia_CCMP2878 / gene_product=hypothetical protein / transcript_product=hypothetical protein / location=Cvel_scaffold233:15784-18704(+) / protein_length=315 / sequence_SO=supercontig / SO=protein_coding / is_pseudo=false